MGIRILKDLQEKEQTRALYEQNFEDPKIFIDYYYHEKCKDNLILVKEEEGQILSMLHLNPYLVSVCGNRVKSFYIFAVATDKNHRHEGHMTELLRAAFSYMKDQKIPFCFLLPVEVAIYEWIGFFVLCDLARERDDSGLPTGRERMEEIDDNYDIYCVRDERYRELLEIEDALARQGVKEDLPEHPLIMVKIIDPVLFAEMAGLKKTTTEEEEEQWMRSKRCYFSEEV